MSKLTALRPALLLTTILTSLFACKTPEEPKAGPSTLQTAAIRPAPAIHPSFKKYRDLVDVAGTKASLSKEEISAVYQAAIEHPVASLDNIAGYDPSGQIGFCFGRSMAAHLIARTAGVKRESVYKIFVLGDLRSEDHTAAYPEWYFHVTTVVLGPKNTWYAIDPIMHTTGTAFTPLTAKQWMNAVTTGWDSTHGRTAKAKFYVTDADAVLPDIRSLPPQAEETGTQLIETVFDPSKHGIAVATQWGNSFNLAKRIAGRTFDITRAHMVKHFLHATPNTQTTFDFDQVNSGTTVFSYNNYFVDLMNSSLAPAPTATAGATSLATQAAGEPKIPPATQWLGGLRLKR